MNDLIQIIKVIDDNEVYELNQYADELQFEPSLVIDKGKGTRLDKSMRTSWGVSLNENDKIVKKLHDKLNQALEEYKKRLLEINYVYGYNPVPGGVNVRSWREGIQLLEYSGGQEYKMHQDVAFYKNHSAYGRVISIILYLTNDFEGGRTIFTHQSYKPPVGSAIIFPSNWCFPHRGEAVTKGKKRVAVTWYFSQPDK